MEKHDVVIVGAGPAGLKAAEVLAAAGRDVLVLEKNDVVGPKVCAGGITLKAIKMGIPEELFERRFCPEFRTKKRILKYSDRKAIAITISREKLGLWQKKRAEEVGAIIKIGARVNRLEKDHVVTDKGIIYFDYLVGADGSSSVIRRELGIKTRKMIMGIQYVVRKNFDDMLYFLDSKRFKSGYAWIFPHGKETLIGCCADMRYLSSTDLKKNFCEWLAEQKIDVDNGRFEAFPINYDYQEFDFGNVFLAGDAAGFASGLTGEGIYFALASGEDIARRILDQNYEVKKIKEILRTKKRHEKLLSLLQKSGCFRQSVCELILFCLNKNRLIKQRCFEYIT